MIAWILGYLIVGELCAIAFVVWVACFNNRFVSRVPRPTWRDLRIYTAVMLLWPGAIFVLLPLTIRLWRRAVQNEICLCSHTRRQHSGLDDRCMQQTASAAFLVSGEGPEHFYCRCPRFTLPNVRPRR